MNLKKRFISIPAILMAVTLSLTACGAGGNANNAATDTSAGQNASETAKPAADSPAPTTESSPAASETTQTDLPPMTLEVYSQASNFQGEQTGWTGKLLKDKFNITLNIIAPQVAGADIFAARSASGFLGDLVILDNIDIQSCIKSGLIFDFTKEMESLASFNMFKPQLDYYNSSLEGVSAGSYYAWPAQMTNTSPTTFTPPIPGVAPTLPWDYYRDAGAPDMKNLTDLVSTLKAIQDMHPTNEDGDPSYGITLWPDWDNTSMENVNQLTKWYGQEVVQGTSSILLDTKGNMLALTDDSGAYKKILQFYFDANQAGVVDPDSGTQNWDSVNKKFNSKRAFLIWNDWQQGFWNTPPRGNAGENYIMAPLDDMMLYQQSDSYFGDGRAFACGTNDSEKKDRVRILMDWMSSPEGLETIHGGIYGFSYVEAPDGNGFDLTEAGESALMNNSPVPEEFGGGNYADGMLQVNQWMVAAISKNPLNNTTFNSQYWPATVEKNKTTTTKEWSQRFNAENPIDYLKKNGKIDVVPFVNVNLVSDPSDISVIRTSCASAVKDASWKMVFAKDQADFDAIWSKLKADLDGFGWAQLVEFDKVKYQALVDERAKVLGE